ncbi:hypothetical protein SCHPADRAFT_945313 [Schizopora paradoxa]|uniref:F-box domain-containing protein n=1 Tax=Schizopora paradoxa TaxID=27342 RepID=A0A0H2R7T5_9AGAM|nr:hypothetical protein SCHPADRAFT_945313 [Schizopora paradoxa]
MAATNCASLWSRNISSGMHPDAFIVACLERSKSAGLHINIMPTFSCSDSFLELIKAESHRWETLSVSIAGMDYESRVGFLRFCEVCDGLFLPQLKELSFEGPYRVRVVDDSFMQFYNKWTAPNLTQSSFSRTVPLRLNFSLTSLNLELPQYNFPYDATLRLLNLLGSLHSLQKLCVAFQPQYYFRFQSRTPVILTSLTALSIIAQANEQSTLLAPHSLISSLQIPNLTRLCIKLRCDRKYALQYYEREDALLTDLIPDPEHHLKLSSLHLDLQLSSSGLWTGRTPDLQLSDFFSNAPCVQNFVVVTNFNIAPLLADDSIGRMPPLLRVEFRDCESFQSEDVSLWIGSLKRSECWNKIEEIILCRCPMKNSKFLDELSSERKIQIIRDAN